MKMNKLMAWVITVAMLFTLVPTAAFAEQTHTHPICGEAHTNIGNHTGTCNSVTYTPWNGTDEITYTNNVAYVYLQGSKSISSTFKVESGKTLYLCLNGYTLKHTGDTREPVIMIDGGTLNICNCGSSGAIQNATNQFSSYGVHNKAGVLNIYGGTIKAVNGKSAAIYNSGTNYTTRIYGGTAQGDYGAYCGGNNGKMYVYGGTFNGMNSSGNASYDINLYSSYDAVYLSGSPTLDLIMGGSSPAQNLFADDGEGNPYTGGTIKLNWSSTVGGAFAVRNVSEANKDKFGIVSTKYHLEYTKYSESSTANDALLIKGAPYTVTLVTNGGTIADGKNVTSYYYGEGAQLPTAQDITKTGYTFGGWYVNESLTGSAVTAISTSDSENKTYYAKWTEIPHTHPACGDAECSRHGADVTWTAWESTNSLPTTAGNYYLTADVSTNAHYDLNSNINICLNGHKITYTGTTVLWNVTGGTLGICDCSEGGKITVSNSASSIAYLGGNAVFNLYGGYISTDEGNTILNGFDETHCTVNVYGGTIHSVKSPAIGAAVMTINLYGGTISSDEWDALIINTNSAKVNLLGNIAFSYPATKSAIKTRATGTIDASGYTGGNIAVYYAKSNPSTGDTVVMNVTDANAGKFTLSPENNSAYILKRSGNNLIYAQEIVHSCQWSYAIKNEHPDTIVATCIGEGECTSTANKELTIIKPLHKKVNDGDETAATLSATSIGSITTLPDIVYYKYIQDSTVDENSTTTTPPANIGGKYKASITIGDVTAYVTYSISRLTRPDIKQFTVSDVTANSFVINLHEDDWGKTDFVCEFGTRTTEFTPDANGRATITVPQSYVGFTGLLVYVYQKQTDIYNESNSRDTIVNLKNPRYTITFDANGGSGTMEPMSINVGVETELTQNTFTRSGYTFDGWATSANGEKVYDDRQQIMDIASEGGNITLYARWIKLVASAPSITAAPQGFTGDDALTYGSIDTDKKLSVEVTADTSAYDIAYQWYKNSTNSKDGATVVSGGTSKDLAIASNLNAGDYYYYCKITATRKDNGDFASVETDLAKVTVNKRPVTISADATEFVYDGTEKTVTISITNAVSGDTVNLTVTGNKATAAGNYTATISAVDNANYTLDGAETTKTWTISKSGTEFTHKKALKGDAETTDFVYGDIITIKIKPESTGVTLSSLTAPEAEQMALYIGDTQITNAVSADGEGFYTMDVDTTTTELTYGDVTLTAKYVGNANTSDYAEDITITLTKADALLATVPTPVEGLIYNKEAQALIVAGSGAVGGTLKYKLGDGEYSEEIPVATDAGDYTVYYKVVGDANHNDTAEQSVAVSIAKKKVSPVIEIPAPVAGKEPVLSLETEEYTAEIIWSPEVGNKFEAKVEYTATVLITPKANYTITGVAENEFEIEDATTSNEAGSGNVTAGFEKTKAKTSGSSYTVSFNSDGGSFVKSQFIKSGNKVIEPADPTKDGYEFGGWYTDLTFSKKYNFNTGISKGFTLFAKWIAVGEEDTHDCPSAEFNDLDVDMWYHLDIDYVIEKGLMNGVSKRDFAPNANLTRAMLVTVLYRNEGEPATNRSIPFADIDMGAYYANAVIWAQQNGIVNGISDTEFAPDANITREQIAAILFRYSVYKGMDAVTMEENLLHFKDAESISEYAVSAMNWAVGTGLMKGRTETTLNPGEKATRAEIAAILHRFIGEE